MRRVMNIPEGAYDFVMNIFNTGNQPYTFTPFEAEMADAIRHSEPYNKGDWIEKVESRGFFAGDKTVYSYTCPFCGVKEFQKYPFCHCGADMRKGDTNDV